MTNLVKVPIKTGVTAFLTGYVAGKSQATEDKYRYALGLLPIFLEGYHPEIKHWGAVESEHLSEFLGYFYPRKVMGSSSEDAKSIISALRTSTRWLDKQYGLTTWATYAPVYEQYRTMLPNALRAASMLKDLVDEHNEHGRWRAAGEWEIDVDGFWRVVRVKGESVSFGLADAPDYEIDMQLPREIAVLLEPGISIYLAFARRGRRKHSLDIVMVGSVVLD